MKILLFGGTTEGRELSQALVARGDDGTVCVATDYGREEQAQVHGAVILTGRKGPDELKELLPQYDCCIDATHPYATKVTSLLKESATELQIPFYRVRRELSTTGDPSPEGVRYFASPEDVAEALRSEEGNVLLATGTKELSAFAELSPERLFPRVLPSAENLEACEALGIPRRNIIAMQGPFSTELNEAILHQKNIGLFVTKDGGATGGFPEKAEAARRVGIPLLVILPPEDDGCSINEILEALS